MPQQNNIAERKNRTIVEMAKSMLKAKGLPNKLWAEAVHRAVYIHNTPFEAWYRRKQKVISFRVFRCIAYAHTPSQQRELFDEKGKKYLFIGYSDESKGYRLLNPKTYKLVISRDVIFDEMKT